MKDIAKDILDELLPGGKKLLDEVTERANASHAFDKFIVKHYDFIALQQAVLMTVSDNKNESSTQEIDKLAGVQQLLYNLMALAYFAAKDEKLKDD
jgi:hypothetical protein